MRGVLVRKRLQLFRQLIKDVDRGRRADRDASAAIDAFRRIDVQLRDGGEIRLILGRMNAIDRAGLDAVFVLGASVGDNVSHLLFSPLRNGNQSANRDYGEVLSFQSLPTLILKSDQFRVRDLAHTRMFIPHPARSRVWLASNDLFLYASRMFGKPRQLETEAELYESAIKILMRRAHSVSEMKKALARRCEDEKLVQSVVARLKRENLLDDARYAKQFARHRSESRKQGQFRIARELRARGVPDRHIESAIEEAAKESDPAALVRQRIERKLRLWRGEIDRKKTASLYRSLLAAGFPADLIRRELHRMTREDVPEVDTDL